MVESCSATKNLEQETFGLPIYWQHSRLLVSCGITLTIQPQRYNESVSSLGS